MVVVDHGSPAVPQAKQAQALLPRKAELVSAMNHLDHTHTLSITGLQQLQRCSFLSSPVTPQLLLSSVPLCLSTFNLCSASALFFCHVK